MHSAVTTSSSPSPATANATPHKSRQAQNPRKKRVVRRRGRAQQNGIESDDEIVREAASDSEFDDEDDDDDRSSLDSATDDSDTEPASEDAPSHLESPPAPPVVGVAGETHINGVAPFFASTSTWSEMVAEETAHGPSGLPVIDFAEFDSAAKVPATRRGKKAAQKQRKQQPAPGVSEPSKEQPQPTVGEPQPEAAKPEPTQPTTSTPALPRKLGQTARQAYQQRLESDPSYVPKVGGFWGHDDRLMEKDLRSLSGWWRGKWSGRARGRGFGMRGGARGEHGSHEVNPEDLPPVERQWTHDGFEEMKRKEERRQDSQAAAGPTRGGFRGGRGGFAGRGRRSFGNRFASSPASSGRALSPAAQQNRIWFPVKPELKWSKQSDAFLFFDPPKGRQSNKSGIRVKLPGKQEQVVQVTQSLKAPSYCPVSTSTSEPKEPLNYTIRIPKPQEKAPQLQAESSTQQDAVEPTPVETQLGVEESLPQPTPAPSSAPPAPVEQAPASAASTTHGFPDPSVISQLEQLSLDVTPSDPERQAKTVEAVLRNPGVNDQIENEAQEPEAGSSTADQRPVLPPLQTVFTPPPPPVSQPSPYGSPYTFAQALPPGIALNHQGMPYEVATGRPVYLQPPPPMYNPRPMHYPPPGMPYMHNHVHHPPAVSPDYLAQPPSHTPPMNGFVDPSTGAPIFSLPRSVRIEIRAPGEDRIVLSTPPTNGTILKSPPVSHTPSKLRTGATAFEPSRLTNGSGEYYPSINTPSDGSTNTHPPSYETTNGLDHTNSNGVAQQHQHQQQGHMMPHYAPYQPPYYYPEPYGYSGYIDMSHGQYDMYNMDHQHSHSSHSQPPQGTVYY